MNNSFSIFLLILFLSINSYSNDTNFEKEKLKFEKEKFEFEKFNEKRKEDNELNKHAISTIAIILPILLGFYSIRAQSRSNQKLKQIEIDNLFALKAAEIVMSAKNPFAVKNKAEILLDIFNDKLPENFVESFNPEKHAKPGPSPDSKIELLKLINSNPGKEKEIVELWLRMFPKDTYEKLFPGDNEKNTTANSGLAQ